MKSLTIGAFASVLALVSALPLEKKDVVIQTVVEHVIKTVDATTTVWVTPGQASPTEATVVQPSAPVQKQEQRPGGPKEAPSPATTTSTSSAPPPPPPSTTSSTTTSAAAYVPPPSSYVAPTSATSTYVPSTTADAAPTPPSSGSCGDVGGSCSGDVTYYDTTDGLTPEVFKVSGYGACGWLNNGTTEDVFALAHDMFGAQSNGNPHCGRMATFTLNGKSASGKLVDKCGACQGQSVDLSDHLFAALGADVTTGRYFNVGWKFTS